MESAETSENNNLQSIANDGVEKIKQKLNPQTESLVWPETQTVEIQEEIISGLK